MERTELFEPAWDYEVAYQGAVADIAEAAAKHDIPGLVLVVRLESLVSDAENLLEPGQVKRLTSTLGDLCVNSLDMRAVIRRSSSLQEKLDVLSKETTHHPSKDIFINEPVDIVRPQTPQEKRNSRLRRERRSKNVR
jgi:hypothetical protein